MRCAASNRPRLSIIFSFIAFLGCIVSHGEPAHAGHLTDFTQEEFRTLPRLCLAQQFINEELESPVVPKAEREQLATSLGHSFLHYHHYCWALLYKRRAAQPGGDKYNYRRAVNNFDYVIRNADPGFSLLPQVHVEKGNVLRILGEAEKAVAEYRGVLQAKPDYAPASVALAQHYIDAGDSSAARSVIEEGLKHDPSSQELAEKKAALVPSR